MVSREENLYNAQMAEQAQRYQDMATYMKEVALCSQEMSIEERNHLSLAYKRLVGGRRNAWRGVYNLERKEASKGATRHLETIQGYRRKIEKELASLCNEFIDIIDLGPLKASSSFEAQVYFTKMKADYHRYLTEFQSVPENKQVYGNEATDQAFEAYQLANEMAVANLPTTHPTRLELVLNYAVFYQEVLNEPDRACMLAKLAFDEAMADLDELTED